MSTSNKLMWIVGGIAALGLCLVCGMIFSFQSTQVQMNAKQQAVQRGNAQYGGALDIVTQKIVAAFNLADKQIAHEDRTYQALAEARKAYDNALASGNAQDQVTAAGAFNLAFQALAEDNPEFASAEVVSQAMNTMEEAVNEVFTAFQDQQDAVLDYNTFRNSLFMPVIVGNVMGYPRAYDYYEGETQRLDIPNLLGTPSP